MISKYNTKTFHMLSSCLFNETNAIKKHIDSETVYVVKYGCNKYINYNYWDITLRYQMAEVSYTLFLFLSFCHACL